MNTKLVNAIVANADAYYRRYLAEYDAGDLTENWWKAFDFFLGHACFQGRRDEVSYRVYKGACEVLAPLFSDGPRDGNYDAHEQEAWEGIRTQLKERIGKGKVGKARDVDMISSALSFIGALPNKNIVAHSVSKIQARKVQEHYIELQRAESPRGIV